MPDDNNKNNTACHIGFDATYGYSLEQLLAIPAPREPQNFNAYWQARYQQAISQETSPKIKDSGRCFSDWRIFDLSYTSTGNFPIRGWLLLPKSGIVKRGFIIGHGYGGRDAPDFHLPFKDSALLFPCFRGLALSSQKGISSEPYWHVLHNIHQRDQYILGGCVEDVWTAVSAMLVMFPQLAGHLGYLGISFAGGIGALALACETRIARGHLNVPTFGHQSLRLRLPTQGSAHSVQNYYQRYKKQTLQVIRYFDAALAAKHITMPMHLACAKLDPCVAPPGQFAIYNALPNQKQLFVLDAGHYGYPNQAQQESILLEQLDQFFAPLRQ
ncbi:acetylxylan esterase [Methylosoma difficile]